MGSRVPPFNVQLPISSNILSERFVFHGEFFLPKEDIDRQEVQRVAPIGLYVTIRIFPFELQRWRVGRQRLMPWFGITERWQWRLKSKRL